MGHVLFPQGPRRLLLMIGTAKIQSDTRAKAHGTDADAGAVVTMPLLQCGDPANDKTGHHEPRLEGLKFPGSVQMVGRKVQGAFLTLCRGKEAGEKKGQDGFHDRQNNKNRPKC
jgi:hypothetical protein